MEAVKKHESIVILLVLAISCHSPSVTIDAGNGPEGADAATPVDADVEEVGAEELEPCSTPRTTLPPPTWVAHIPVAALRSRGYATANLTPKDDVVGVAATYQGRVALPKYSEMSTHLSERQVLLTEFNARNGFLNWAEVLSTNSLLARWQGRPLTHLGNMLFGGVRLGEHIFMGTFSTPNTSAVGWSIDYRPPHTFGPVFQMNALPESSSSYAIASLETSRNEAGLRATLGHHSSRIGGRYEIRNLDDEVIQQHSVPAGSMLALHAVDNSLLWLTGPASSESYSTFLLRSSDLLLVIMTPQQEFVWKGESHTLPVGRTGVIASIDLETGNLRWFRPFHSSPSHKSIQPFTSRTGERFCAQATLQGGSHVGTYSFQAREGRANVTLAPSPGDTEQHAIVCFDEEGYADSSLLIDLGVPADLGMPLEQNPSRPSLNVNQGKNSEILLSISFEEALLIENSAGESYEAHAQQPGTEAALVRMDDSARLLSLDTFSTPSNAAFLAALPAGNDIIVVGAFQHCAPFPPSDSGEQRLEQPFPSDFGLDGFVARFPSPHGG